MANEVQKSIQISYKADLKDLMAKLKQIPNVTDQEAKKMVSALDRQLKQAEKGSKESQPMPARKQQKKPQMLQVVEQKTLMIWQTVQDKPKKDWNMLQMPVETSTAVSVLLGWPCVV